ncbi:MAG: SpoIIE family protein phosphatase [Desulfotalea sp.]
MKTVEEITILFVDDEQSVLSSLRRFLRKEKYQTYFASGGKEALEMMASQEINIIVSDLRMPEMNGLDLLSRVKSHFPETLRVILSATRDVEQTIDSINTGEVFRFIPKPLDPEPFKQIMTDAIEYFLMKTQRQELLEELSTTNTYLNKAMIKIKEVNAEKEKMAEETRFIECRIEQNLLQSEVPGGIEGATIAASTIPSGHLDGDFFDFVKFSSKQFDVVVADVMGKGIQSALVAAGIKAMILKSLAEHDCSLGMRLSCPRSPADITAIENVLSLAHEMSIQKLIKLNMFVTLCYVRFNLERSEMAFLDCGHTKTIHYRAREKAYSFLEGDNLPLGMEEHSTYVSKVIHLQKNDLLIFYSDGVTEAENEKGDCFGPEKLAELVKRNEHLHPQKIIEKIQEMVIDFSGQDSFEDDFTCIVIRID